MQIYEVGGAIRDALLGEVVGERDWVVVGATPDEMLELGYRQVGKDFPVFLHPQTGEEYALARTERKTAPGHTGFAVDIGKETSLIADLRRRDLTINAIARDREGNFIDPYGGRQDIQNRVLRHVSDAFGEDPLRVLRVARFAARFHEQGFTIADETLAIMRQVAASGELDSLRPERIWIETEKALATARPDIYFDVLRSCECLAIVYPEIDRLFGVPQPQEWHPEIDTGVHTLMALRVAASLSNLITVRFAVLTHDLGKGTTPKHLLPRHHGHGERSVDLLRQLSKRLPVPRKALRLAELVARHHGTVHRAESLSAKATLKLISATDGLRQPTRFDEFLIACEADARGRLGLEDAAYPQGKLLRASLSAAQQARIATVAENSTLQGPALGEAIRARQLTAIEQARHID
jgi:tRNA nucleotidyltransferase (CCA-adding enzyme)